jgi:hypothetical protein
VAIDKYYNRNNNTRELYILLEKCVAAGIFDGIISADLLTNTASDTNGSTSTTLVTENTKIQDKQDKQDRQDKQDKQNVQDEQNKQTKQTKHDKQDEPHKLQINTLVTTSWLNEDYILPLLEQTDYEHLYLLEDGFYDYTPRTFTVRYAKTTTEATLLVNDVRNATNKGYFADVVEIPQNADIINTFCELVGFRGDILDGLDLLVFTSPLDADYGLGHVEIVKSYLSEHYASCRIGVKRHPRDDADYSDNEGKYQVMDVDISVPGQLVDGRAECEKLYVYPSTILLTSKDNTNTTVMRFVGDGASMFDDKYYELFEYPKIAECTILDIRVNA